MLTDKKFWAGGNTLIFLHGWGKSGLFWTPITTRLQSKFKIYTLDLPGFGKTKLKRGYDLSDYVADVEEFIKKQKIEKPILAGHSFGGRVAIKFALTKPELLGGLILIDSAGIERKSLMIRLIGQISRIGRIGLIQKVVPWSLKEKLADFFRSPDYQNAHEFLRETMRNVVNENLEPQLLKISLPVLIIWGENDNTTPLWQGKLMHRLIKNSKIEIVAEGDHGLPYRRPEDVAKIILAHC